MDTENDRCDDRGGGGGRTRPPQFYEVGGLPGERYPDLHERQIEREVEQRKRRQEQPRSPAPGSAQANEQWARKRERRLLGHARRVERDLRRHSRRPPPGETTNGRKQEVWCRELRFGFPSLSAAARFVGRAPSNILQSIRQHVRCGGYHWERFDPRRHAGVHGGGSDGDGDATGPTTPAAGGHAGAAIEVVAGTRAGPAAMAARADRAQHVVRRDWRSVAREIAAECVPDDPANPVGPAHPAAVGGIVAATPEAVASHAVTTSAA